jgi:hypothetical protein
MVTSQNLPHSEAAPLPNTKLTKDEKENVY